MNSAAQKRIALISVHGDPAIEIGKEEAGGQNVYVRQVGEALAQLGWQVDMFTRKASAEQKKIVQHHPNCRTIRLTAGPEEFVPRDNIFCYAPDFVVELLKFQEDEGVQYSLVHTNYWISSWVGMQLKKYKGSKQVHTYHSLGAVKYQSVSTIPLIANTRLKVEKEVLETAERIVATSPQEEKHMRSLVSTEGNIDMIPCGTDIHRFGSIQQQQARQQLEIDPQTKVVFYVGRFDQRKGIETLVRAVAQPQLRGNADLKLIIAGGSRPGQSDGIERDRIQTIVAELGMSDFTIFPGRLDDDILPVYYAAADVCVVPSHYEPFGLVAIEAMASRTPVVASKVGGLEFTVVNKETGLLVPPKDEKAFADAIGRILSDSTYRNKLAQAARKRVETEFTWEGVAFQLDKLYNKLLEQPAKVPAANPTGDDREYSILPELEQKALAELEQKALAELEKEVLDTALPMNPEDAQQALAELEKEVLDTALPMNPEDAQQFQKHIQGIAKILYNHTAESNLVSVESVVRRSMVNLPLKVLQKRDAPDTIRTK